MRKSLSKKRILIPLILAVMLLVTLCACSNEEETYNGYTKDQLMQVSVQTWSALDSLTFEDAVTQYMYYSQQAATSDDESLIQTTELLSDWVSIYPELGEGEGEIKDFVADKSGKTLTTTLTVAYPNRDAKIVYVYNTFDMSVTAVNAELVYTMGETMQKAALNVVMGLGTVFIILILISLCIYAFRLIPYITKKMDEKKAKSASGETFGDEQSASEPMPVTKNEPADGELIAVIAAAIAAATGTTTDDFIVRSIKRRA